MKVKFLALVILAAAGCSPKTYKYKIVPGNRVHFNQRQELKTERLSNTRLKQF